MNIWRVNLRSQKLSIEAEPENWKRLGGRGLCAKVLLDEVPPTCEPLGPKNKLVFATGLLLGYNTESDRLSIGGKSPLTGGIKEANAGGTTAQKMGALGIKALILEDQPEAKGWWILHLSKDGARFEPAGSTENPGTSLAGKGVYEAAEILQAVYGKSAALALIGPGGEMRLTAAGIQNLDKDGVPSRIAARGGLGAVMGAMGLKAIVFDAPLWEKPPLADPEAYRLALKKFMSILMALPQTEAYRDYGTAAMAQMCNWLGALPTRNYSSGTFEEVENISGEMLRSTILDRGGEGKPTHNCMAGCGIRCSNIYAGIDGKTVVAPLEYETIGLMGSNLGMPDLDIVARLNWEVNDLGLDSIEIGAAMGVAAEAGYMEFSDAESALRLVDEMRKGTPLGRILGCGAVVTGKVLGVTRVPAVKGQAMAAYEPRAIKGTGVTYATSPMGADHTAGLTIRAKIDHLDPMIQADLSRNAQLNMAGYDTLGACIFAGFGFAAAPESIRDLLNAKYGWSVGTGILQELGRECISLEREFNKQAGFTPAHDRLPEWMTKEALPPKNAVFDVPEEELDRVWG
ncbi:MAG: aldehyde ferredoxin oxidoreductase [Chloroflexi bacterium]|nr:MAG: aldehyde ferredoxin oxidoreductase [Chloroflexota bacterium]